MNGRGTKRIEIERERNKDKEMKELRIKKNKGTNNSTIKV
jgi:hypothetical protein